MINTQTYIIQIDAKIDPLPSPFLPLFGGIEWGMQTWSKVRLSYGPEWFHINQRNTANMGSKNFLFMQQRLNMLL